MKRDHLISALVVLLIIAVIVWVARSSYWVEETAPPSLSGEALRNPFYAVQRFSESLGAKTQWQRVLGTPPSQDSVIFLSTWHWSLLEQRREALERWVAAGGRLVVDRSLIGGEHHLKLWAGIEHQYNETKKEPTPPLSTEGKRCSQLEVRGSNTFGGGRNSYLVCSIEADSHLTSDKPVMWSLNDSQGMQALRVNVGRGSFTVVNAIPFRNHLILDGDHAALFAAATQLRRGDSLYFMSDDEGESLVRLIWRLGAPVIVLAALLIALALWRSGSRFGPLTATPDLARRSLGEQILGTGRFTLRFGGGRALHAATVRALNEAASRRIMSFDSLPTDQRIAALAKAAKIDADTLTHAINYSGPRRAGELRNTVALLESARRMVLNKEERPSHAD